LCDIFDLETGRDEFNQRLCQIEDEK